MDAASGRVLAAQNENVRRGMASTTKIMTAVVALEQGNPDDIVTVSNRAANVEGSSMWLKPGEKIKLESLLYGLMLNSGNDAATAIAEHVGGSAEGFAEMMNKKAVQLGLKDTHFTNPHGLDNEKHYTTAYELGLIACYALKNEKFREIAATKEKTVEGLENGLTRTLNNHNKMLKLYDNADGVKTGFTKKCGRCLVSSATRNGMQLVAVTLNAPDDWNDHKSLLNYGFAKYKAKTLVTKGSYIKTVPVKNGRSGTVGAVIGDTVSVAVKQGENPVLKIDMPESLDAPVVLGQKLGTACVMLGGKEYAKTDITAQIGVAKKLSSDTMDTAYYLAMELLSFFTEIKQ